MAVDLKQYLTNLYDLHNTLRQRKSVCEWGPYKFDMSQQFSLVICFRIWRVQTLSQKVEAPLLIKGIHRRVYEIIHHVHVQKYTT